jgi:hypothetical protein
VLLRLWAGEAWGTKAEHQTMQCCLLLLLLLLSLLCAADQASSRL